MITDGNSRMPQRRTCRLGAIPSPSTFRIDPEWKSAQTIYHVLVENDASITRGAGTGRTHHQSIGHWMHRFWRSSLRKIQIVVWCRMPTRNNLPSGEKASRSSLQTKSIGCLKWHIRSRLKNQPNLSQFGRARAFGGCDYGLEGRTKC